MLYSHRLHACVARLSKRVACFNCVLTRFCDFSVGKNGRGLLEPIKVDAHYNGLGLGKKVEDEEHNAVAAKERRKLAIEKVDISAEERARRDKTKEKIEVNGLAVHDIIIGFACKDELVGVQPTKLRAMLI